MTPAINLAAYQHVLQNGFSYRLVMPHKRRYENRELLYRLALIGHSYVHHATLFKAWA
jgi:hypothetical protein